MISITRHIEFDAGHRVPSHASKCRNAHGHRYKMDVTVTGKVLEVRGESDDGMIFDFSNFKGMLEEVIEPFDHSFMVYDGDSLMIHALKLLGDVHKTRMLDIVPTVENLVCLFAVLIRQELKKHYPSLTLTKVVLWETTNSWAEWVS